MACVGSQSVVQVVAYGAHHEDNKWVTGESRDQCKRCQECTEVRFDSSGSFALCDGGPGGFLGDDLSGRQVWAMSNGGIGYSGR